MRVSRFRLAAMTVLVMVAALMTTFMPAASASDVGSAIKTYFSPSQQLIAAAVMLAESSGNRFAVGPNGEKGLFQLMAGTPGCDWTNVYCNVRTAAAMEAAQGWLPWATFTSGKFREFLGEAAGLLGGSGTLSVSTSSGSVHHRHRHHHASGCAGLRPGRASFGVLQRGDRGFLVRQVQARAGTHVDGVFGSRTAAAVRRAQERGGVFVDAKVGRQTACVLGLR